MGPEKWTHVQLWSRPSVSHSYMANTGKVFFIADLPFQTRDPSQPTENFG